LCAILASICCTWATNSASLHSCNANGYNSVLKQARQWLQKQFKMSCYLTKYKEKQFIQCNICAEDHLCQLWICTSNKWTFRLVRNVKLQRMHLDNNLCALQIGIHPSTLDRV
jgi:hypothetical protein